MQAAEKVASLSRAFERFVPKQFLEHLKKESISSVKLGDFAKKKMSIMFSDIRSFTSLSESMTPEENFKFLNSFLKRMEPVIRKFNGFIDKFIGDAIMALFDENADKAVMAGIDMLKELKIYNGHRAKQGYIPIRIGVAINTGDLILGTVGGEFRMDSTVISDAVNLASRLEGLTKVYETQLLISQETYNNLNDPTVYKIRLIDCVIVKGKDVPVIVYEVLDVFEKAIQEKKLKIQKEFEKGIELYQHKNISEANKVFQNCLIQYPEDNVVKVYIKRCAQILKYGFSENWDGITRLNTK